MSVPVALSELAEQIERFGPNGYAVTTGEGGAAHVVSVTVAWQDAQLRIGVEMALRFSGRLRVTRRTYGAASSTTTVL